MTIPVETGRRYEADVIDHTLEGAGVCRVEGYTVFVEGALKGERVAFEPMKVLSRYATARLLAVRNPSHHRAKPFCPDYAPCGGCSLQHMDYARHLEVLTDGLRAALRRVPGVTAEIIPSVLGMADPFHYRCKAVFSAAKKDPKGSIALGFLAEKSHTVVPVGDCALLHPAVMDAARTVEAEAGTPDSPLGNAGVRQLMVRCGLRTVEFMAVLTTNKPLPEADTAARRLYRRLPGLTSLYIQTGEGKPRLLTGKPFITEKILGLSFRISPDSFFQVNPLQTDVLYDLVRRHTELTAPALLLDAYCGTGSIALAVAGAAGRVLGVESVSAAVDDARENARLNGITNAEFRTGKAEKEIPALLRQGLRPDMLVVDPPRRGLDSALIGAAKAASIPRIVYVSCNPFTLARDLGELVKGGYQVRDVQGVDMFPWTGHVETVVLITRVK